MRPGLSPPATVRPNAARLLPCRPKGPNLPRLRTRRSTKGHKGLPEWACRCEAPNLPRLPPMFRRFARKTLRYLADWSRLGAGYRRQDAPGKLGSLEAWTGLCPSPRRGALCSLWPWKVWPFGPARSVAVEGLPFGLHALLSALWGGIAVPESCGGWGNVVYCGHSFARL